MKKASVFGSLGPVIFALQIAVLSPVLGSCADYSARDALSVFAQIDKNEKPAGFIHIADISYKEGPSEYEKERCRLDLYLPKDKKNFPVIVWFHGGGLKAGDKSEEHAFIPAKALAMKNMGVVLANYRLNPKVKFPEYLNDAASAVKWTIDNIDKYGGDSKNVFIGGHSAGAFLTYMLGLDARFLKNVKINTVQINGLIPVSSQVYCHSTIREESGIQEKKIINETCPLFYIYPSAPPIKCLLAEGDVIKEDNQLLVKKLKDAGHPDCDLIIFPKRDHSSIISEMKNSDDPVLLEIVKFINDKSRNN